MTDMGGWFIAALGFMVVLIPVLCAVVLSSNQTREQDGDHR